MAKNLLEKFLSLHHYLIFKYIGPKMRADSLKDLMNLSFVLFEKIAYKFEIIVSFYLKIYEEMVEKEIKMSDVSSEDSVLVIGGGSIPITPMLISTKTGANVTSIDIDQKAIKLSSKFIENLSIKNKIKFEHADGSNYPVERFNVIFLSYGVKGEKEVLSHLSSNMIPKARLVFRTTLDFINNKNKIDFLHLFNVKNHVCSKSLGRIDSFLLYKKNN